MLTIKVEQNPSCHIVRVNGELTLQTLPKFVRELNLLLQDPKRHVVLDGRHMHHIDSTALAVWVDYQHKCEDAGLFLRLAHLQDGVLQLIALAHLTSYFQIYATVEDAMA